MVWCDRENHLMKQQGLRVKYRNLAINQTIKTDCPECRRRNKFYVTRKLNALVYNCYVCHYKGRIRMDKPTLHQRNAYRKQKQELDNLYLPKDYTTTLTGAAKTFMMKYALDYGLLDKYGVGYSEKLGRVIYPLHNKGVLKGIQTRLLVDDPDAPKYMTHGQKPPYICPHGTSKDLVITEDILSAIKLNEYTNALCLLGTVLSFDHIKHIIEGDFKRVFVWLDNDEAGIKGRKHCKKKLALYGIDAIILTADGDPKETFHHIIKEKLNV